MKSLDKKIFWFIVLLMTMGCEEVIDIDLNTSNPVIIAEGVIEKDNEPWLKLSYSSDYFTPEESDKIEDADIVIADNAGITDTLFHEGNGFYKSNKIIGQEKVSYDISILIDGETYEASTYIYSPSKIIDVKFEESDMKRPGNDEGADYDITIIFTDEIGVNNFYMLKFTVNNELQTDTYDLIDDSFYSDNGSIEYSPMRISFELDDDVEIELFSIDEGTYTYYSQLNDLGGGMMGGGSTPYNPRSNFGEDIMGYFAGWSVVSYYTKVQ